MVPCTERGSRRARRVLLPQRLALLPHLRLPGRRELLFRMDHLEAHEAGACELETVNLPGGGRLVRPHE